MKKLIVVLALLAITHVIKAQYVTIPDAKFRSWLATHDYCITGNQMDTTCPNVVNARFINCSFQGIVDLTGIRYFDNLTELHCYDNKITNLSSLPPKLDTLRCGDNSISHLPSLPASITYLEVSLNQTLDSLPPLPASLKILLCVTNLLKKLPPLPSSLTELYCNNNYNLTSLPALPSTLTRLNCSTNKLATLPALPSSLQVLLCYSNKLTVLPSLPSSLNSINCQLNLLTQLPPLPASLRDLNCSNNQITALPALPNLLTDLHCSNNLLTALPTLPDSLHTFEVNNNIALSCIPPLLKYGGIAFYFNISKTAITCFPNVIQHAGSMPVIDTVPICGACTVPTHNMGKITSNAATVVWTKQDCIYNYHVQYRKKGTTAWNSYVSGAAATFRKLTGLTPATQYQVRMSTACSPGNSTAWSAIQTFTTDKVCTPPTGVTVTNLKINGATINWTAVAGAYSYQVRYRVQGTSTWTKKVAKAPVTHKVITGLTANTIYEYQLITVCDTTGAQASGWTSIGTFTTLLRVGEEADAVSFTMYPNPASEQLTVISEQLTESSELIVTDMLGRTLISLPIAQGTNRTAIDVSELANGVYLLTLKTEGGITTRKFVKE